MKPQITVSVCMITYNHQEYINKAVLSVLKQKCDFEIELILLDDCSTDSTKDVIDIILQNNQNSSRIKYVRQKENIGMMSNFVDALKLCKGKYIALCDGDDYWTDVNKLQKQIQFLETNKEYVACFHNAEKIGIGFNGEKYCNFNYSRDVSKEEIILAGGAIYPTASFFFRNEIDIKEFDLKSRAGDTILIYHLLNKGLFYYFNDIMCVYRKHLNGVYTSIKMDNNKIIEDLKSNIKILIFYRKKYCKKFRPLFNETIQNQLLKISSIKGFEFVIKMRLINLISFYDLCNFIKKKFFKL
ncbi:glycosyltransferase involved in cell wall biosynthesis [Lutibacter sp. Hel_I_33_5]|uniref:glycosyltransferase family 2 protein n=1 Tax=Lutibacter sp. Hel_I_33_5 TaxID=1566289 RepID=UPI0011A0F763|nr:glycosyltransferase [Lutibacter sp. Hel_I_33_5]TVZ54853.1 glycosyltransferase involved in cell wall biosynthesis [Lutibacter sp. Hel_I_33_5]